MLSFLWEEALALQPEQEWVVGCGKACAGDPAEYAWGRPSRVGPHEEIREPGSRDGQGGKNPFPLVGSVPESDQGSGFTEGGILITKLLLLALQIQELAVLKQTHVFQTLLKPLAGLARWHGAVSQHPGRMAPDPFTLVARQWRMSEHRPSRLVGQDVGAALAED